MTQVLNAEGITDNFWVEGTSYGTSHAMAVAHYFGARVEKLHLHIYHIYQLR
jgi:pimeloyl-ACP methyl ester carboxylesterase